MTGLPCGGRVRHDVNWFIFTSCRPANSVWRFESVCRQWQQICCRFVIRRGGNSCGQKRQSALHVRRCCHLSHSIRSRAATTDAHARLGDAVFLRKATPSVDTPHHLIGEKPPAGFRPHGKIVDDCSLRCRLIGHRRRHGPAHPMAARTNGIRPCITNFVR